MRLRKSDPTGNYWYLCDGVSPASDVLSDGYTSFTPGLSEITGAGSRFYLPDAQGNSRGLLDGGQVNTDGYNWDGWGNLVSRIGSNPTAFAWNVSSGYQSDGDSGLKLLGRPSRYISRAYQSPVPARTAPSSAPRCRTWRPGTTPGTGTAPASPTTAGTAPSPSGGQGDRSAREPRPPPAAARPARTRRTGCEGGEKKIPCPIVAGWPDLSSRARVRGTRKSGPKNNG